MNLPVRMMLRLGTGAGLALALAACGPDDAQQSKLADVEWPFDRAGLDSGWPGGAGLPPLPEAEPMLDAGGGYDDDYRDSGPSSVSYASYRGGDRYNYGYAPAYFDDAYADEPDDAYWVDDGPNGNSYALIALAAVLGGVFADAPPDYGFAYDGVQPWAWETGDRYRRYAEPIPGGWRTYWYAPEADYPFLVQDPYYSYGYRENRVAVIYDRGGRLIDPGRAWRQRRVADRYYDRGFDLYRASRIADRHGVAAPLWASRRTQFVDTQRNWERVRDRQQGWQQWDRRHDDVMTARWSQEKAVRHYAAGRFDDWRKRDFKGSAPRFYQEAGRDPQVRRTVLAQQASLYRQARAQRVADAREQRQRGNASRGDWQNPALRRDLALAGRPDGGERQRQSLLMQRGGSPREQAMQERAGRQQRIEPAFQRDDRRQLALQQREARRAGMMQGQREQAQQQRQQRMAGQRQQMQDQRAGQMAERRQQMQQQRQAQASQQRQQQAQARQAQMAERRQQAQQQRQAQAWQQRQQQAQARQAQMAQQRQQMQQQRQAQASQQRQQQAQARQAQMAQQRQQMQQQRQAQASQQRQQQAQARQAQMAQQRQQMQQQRQAQASQQRQQQAQQQMQQRQAQQQARAQQRQQQAMAQGGSGGGGGRERGGGHGRDRP